MARKDPERFKFEDEDFLVPLWLVQEVLEEANFGSDFGETTTAEERLREALKAVETRADGYMEISRESRRDRTKRLADQLRWTAQRNIERLRREGQS